MLLLNVYGEQLTIEDADWAEAIQRARSNGWAARGTRSPARVIGMEHPAWDGAYTAALGQEITRGDARALGHALKPELDSEPAFVRLCTFCERSGFVLTDGTVANPSEEFEPEGAESNILASLCALNSAVEIDSPEPKPSAPGRLAHHGKSIADIARLVKSRFEIQRKNR